MLVEYEANTPCHTEDSYRAGFLRCGLYVASDEDEAKYPDFLRRQRRDWLRHSGSYPKAERKL